MLQAAARDHNLALDQSFMVGDTVSDMGAGKNAGCRTILVQTGYGAGVRDADDLIDFEAPDMAGAAAIILNEGRI